MKRILDAQELNVTGRNIKAARLAAKISQQALTRNSKQKQFIFVEAQLPV